MLEAILNIKITTKKHKHVKNVALPDCKMHIRLQLEGCNERAGHLLVQTQLGFVHQVIHIFYCSVHIYVYEQPWKCLSIDLGL